MDSGLQFKRKCIAAEGVIPLSEMYGFEQKAGAEKFSASAELADGEDVLDVKLANNRIIRGMRLN